MIISEKNCIRKISGRPVWSKLAIPKFNKSIVIKIEIRRRINNDLGAHLPLFLERLIIAYVLYKRLMSYPQGDDNGQRQNQPDGKP